MFMHFAPSNGTHAGVCDPNGHVVLRVLPRSLAQVCSLRNMSSRRLRFSVLTGLVSILSRSAEAGTVSFPASLGHPEHLHRGAPHPWEGGRGRGLSASAPMHCTGLRW